MSEHFDKLREDYKDFFDDLKNNPMYEPYNRSDSLDKTLYEGALYRGEIEEPDQGFFGELADDFMLAANRGMRGIANTIGADSMVESLDKDLRQNRQWLPPSERGVLGSIGGFIGSAAGSTAVTLPGMIGGAIAGTAIGGPAGTVAGLALPFANSFLISYGDTVDRNVQNGMDKDSAVGLAILESGLMAGVETALGTVPALGKVFKGKPITGMTSKVLSGLERNLGKAGAKRFLWDLGKNVLNNSFEEGTEEAIQYLIETAGASLSETLGQGTGFTENFSKNFDAGEMGYNALAGAVGGGALGIVPGAVDAVRARNVRQFRDAAREGRVIPKINDKGETVGYNIIPPVDQQQNYENSNNDNPVNVPIPGAGVDSAATPSAVSQITGSSLSGIIARNDLEAQEIDRINNAPESVIRREAAAKKLPGIDPEMSDAATLRGALTRAALAQMRQDSDRQDAMITAEKQITDTLNAMGDDELLSTADQMGIARTPTTPMQDIYNTVKQNLLARTQAEINSQLAADNSALEKDTASLPAVETSDISTASPETVPQDNNINTASETAETSAVAPAIETAEPQAAVVPETATDNTSSASSGTDSGIGYTSTIAPESGSTIPSAPAVGQTNAGAIPTAPQDTPSVPDLPANAVTYPEAVPQAETSSANAVGLDETSGINTGNMISDADESSVMPGENSLDFDPENIELEAIKEGVVIPRPVPTGGNMRVSAKDQAAIDEYQKELPGQKLTGIPIKQVPGSTRRSTLAAINKVARALGVSKVIPITSRITNRETAIAFNGAHLKGTRRNLVNLTNAHDPETLFFTAMHELTHSLIEKDEEAYETLVDEILPLVMDLDEYTRRLANYADGRKITPEEIEGNTTIKEEFICDTVADLMMTERFWEVLSKKDMPLAQKFLLALRELLEKITRSFHRGNISGTETVFQKNLETVIDLAAEFVAEASGKRDLNSLIRKKPTAQVNTQVASAENAQTTGDLSEYSQNRKPETTVPEKGTSKENLSVPPAEESSSVNIRTNPSTSVQSEQSGDQVEQVGEQGKKKKITKADLNQQAKDKREAKQGKAETATAEQTDAVDKVAMQMQEALQSGKNLSQFSDKQLDAVFDFLMDNADNDNVLGDIDADFIMEEITVESESRDETVVLSSVSEITDEDFNNPTRSIILPSLPQKLLNLIGKKLKPVLLKKNILEKNKENHPDLSPQDCRENIGALYNCDLIIQPNPNNKPNYFMLVSAEGKNKQTLLEINENKENFEIVNYHYLDNRQLQQKINRAKKGNGIVKYITGGGLPSPTITQKGAAGSFSALPGTTNTIPQSAEKSSAFVMKDGEMIKDDSGETVLIYRDKPPKGAIWGNKKFKSENLYGTAQYAIVGDDVHIRMTNSAKTGKRYMFFTIPDFRNKTISEIQQAIQKIAPDSTYPLGRNFDDVLSDLHDHGMRVYPSGLKPFSAKSNQSATKPADKPPLSDKMRSKGKKETAVPSVPSVPSAEKSAPEKNDESGNTVLFSLTDDKANFSSALEDFKNGVLDKRKPITVTSDTPSVILKLDLSDLGLRVFNRKITMPYSVIEKAIGNIASTSTGDFHALDIETLKELPENLHNPVMILEGNLPGTIEIYTLMFDKKNNPVMIALAIDVTEKVAGKKTREYIVNSIRSIYGKDNPNTPLNKLKKGKGRYVNMKLADIWRRAVGVQFPEAGDIISGSPYTIIVDDQKVNPVSSKNPENSSGGVKLSMPSDVGTEQYADKIAEIEAEMEEIRAKYDGTDQWMKAPNGKPTNLTEFQWLQVRTKAFKEWFGDWENDPENASKVVDKNSEPLVVYHGSSEDFHIFENQDIKHGREYGNGFYFTSDTERAKGYGEKLYSVFLNIKNPFKRDMVNTATKTFTDIDQAREFFEEKQAEYKKSGNGYTRFEPTADKDGPKYIIRYATSFETEATEKNDGVITGDVYVSFDPTQIKSATDNIGTFDGTNPDIRFSLVNDIGDTSLSPIDYRRSVDPLFDFFMEQSDNGKLNPGADHIGEDFTGSFIADEYKTYSIKRKQGKNETDASYRKYLANREQKLKNAQGITLDELAAAYARKFGGEEKEVAEKFLDMLRHLTKRELVSYRAEAKQEIREYEKAENEAAKEELKKLKDESLTNQVKELFAAAKAVIDKRWVQINRQLYTKLYQTIFPFADSRIPDIPSKREMEIMNMVLENGSMSEASAIAEPYYTDKNKEIKKKLDDSADETLQGFIRGKKINALSQKIKGAFTDPNAKPDITLLDYLIRTPQWIADKISKLGSSVVKSIYQATQTFVEDKARIANYLDNGTAEIFRKLSRNKAEYKKVSEYLRECDINKTGAGDVKEDADSGKFTAVTADGQTIGTFDSEDMAWQALFDAEYDSLVSKGFSEIAAESVRSWRKAMDRAYIFRLDTTITTLRQLGLIDAQSTSFIAGKEFLPGMEDELPDGNVDIFQALKEMGHQRGHYFPRIRHGKYQLIAKKAGEPTIMIGFDTKAERAIAYAKYARKGYTVENRLANNADQDMLSQVNPAALSDILNQAFSRTQDIFKNDIELREVKYTLKDGKTEPHLVIAGDFKFDSNTRQVLKNLGGKIIDGVWHFANPDTKMKENLSEIINGQMQYNIRMTALMQSVIGRSIADMIRENSSASSKIQRRKAVGKDVIRGYEEDPLRAYSLYINGIAGGTARNIMAKKMYSAYAGMNFDREEYIADLIPDDIAPDTPEYRKARMNALAEYFKEVKRRAIDSSKQPNIAKYMDKYIKDMLRNTTGMERTLGFFKGLASVWMLCKPASAFNNLVGAMGTVPSVIDDRTKCGVLWAAKEVGNGLGLAEKYYFYNKFGKGEKPDGINNRIFDFTHKNGWDGAELTADMLNAGTTFSSKAWKQISEKSMFMFSHTESLNRMASIRAAAMALAKQRKIDINSLSDSEFAGLMKEAKSISDFGNGVYNKGNKLSWARGGDISSILDSLLLFRTYEINQLNMIWDMISHGNIKGVLAISASLMLAGGMKVSIIGTILMTALGAMGLGGEGDDGEDNDDKIYHALSDAGYEKLSNVLQYGILSLANINLSGTYQNSFTKLIHEGISTKQDIDLPAFFFLGDLRDAINYARSGSWGKAAESVLPAWGMSISRGAREWAYGVTDRAGRKRKDIFDKYIEPDGWDFTARLLGFNPIGVSEKTNRLWSEKKIKSVFSEERNELYSRYRYMVNHGDPDMDDLVELSRDIEEYNAKVMRSKRNLPLIDAASLANSLKDRDNKTFVENLDDKDKKRREKKIKSKIVIRNGKFEKE